MTDIDFSEMDLSEKEEKILQSSIAIFSQKGFNASTTKEIAKRAGIAEGTVFKYFKTKKGILKAIVMMLVKMIGSKIVLKSVEKILLEETDRDLREILKDLLIDRMKLVDSIYPMAQIVVMEVIKDEEVREVIYEHIISKAMKVFTEFHGKMVEKGLMRDDISPETILRAIVGNFALFIAQRKIFGDKFDFKDLDKQLDNQLDVLLTGIAVKK